MPLSNETADAVVAELVLLGYRNVEYRKTTGFTFESASYPDSFAKLIYQNSVFGVSTTGSNWSTAEAQAFLFKLEKVTKEALQLNHIIHQ